MNTTPNPTQTLYQRLGQTGSDIKRLINSAGQEFGIPENQMHQIGMVESGLRPDVKNARSSATGLYQFTSGTWNEVLTKYGPQHGIPEGTSPKDPAANAILGAAYLSENRDNFKSNYGRDPELTDLYMGHFLGQSGRKKFIDGMQQDPNAPAVNFASPRQVRANPEIFKREDGSYATLQEVYTKFSNKLGAVQDKEEHSALSQLQADPQVSAVQERELSRVLLGQEGGKAAANLAVSSSNSSAINVPLSGPNAQPFADTVADYGLQKVEEPEERSFMDESWEVAKAEARLSPVGQKLNEVSLSVAHRAARAFDLEQNFDPAAMSILQAFSTEMTPEQMMAYDTRKPFVPSAEMLDKAFAQGLDRKWAEYLSKSLTPDEFVRKVQLADEMQKADAVRKGAGTGASITGAIGAAIVDPLSYVPLGLAGKGATWGSRFLFAGAEGAAGGVLSEAMTEWSTDGAIEGEIAAAAIGGFVLGGAARTVLDRLSTPAATRMRARQESLALGQEDMTARPDIEIPEGKAYADIPGEPGAVVDEFGNTHSATSVNNPKLREAAEAEDIRANKGIELGQFSTLSMAVLRSESKETRGIAADLVRSPTGIQGGGSGKTSMTAEDVLGRLEGQDNMWYNKAIKARDSLVDTQGIGREGMEREIVAAIESGDLSKLTPESRKFAEATIELYTRKFDEATNTGRFGNADAPSVFASSRDPKRYVPQVFEEGKVTNAKARLGGTEGWEGLQKALKDNWTAQWKGNHADIQGNFKAAYADEIKLKVDAGKSPDEAVMEAFEEYIEKKSYGISRNGDFTHSAGLEDANLNDSLVGIENNNFTQERNLFDSGFEHLAEDGNPFAVNDLRHFDLMNIAQMYNRRINGDVAIHAATGKDTKALKDRIVNLPEGKDKRHLDQLVRVITGRSRQENQNPAFNAAMRGLQNVAFASNNAQMWVNNLSEVTGWAANRTSFVLRNGVPGLKQMLNPETKFTKADLKDFSAAMFGNDLNTVMTKSFSNTRDNMIRQGVGAKTANVAAGIDQVGAVIASNKWNPYSRMLNYTQEHLTGMARSGVLADITQEAFGGVKLNKATLKNASITPEQHAGILDMLKTHVKQVDGEFKPDTAAIVKDPRANDLWRLADYIASDCVMRTGKVGMNYVQQPNAMMNLALQFKSFTLKGLNARTVRMFHESFHGKSMDNAVRVAVMFGTMNALWAMQTHYRSLAVPEKDRQAYLDKMLDPAMVAYQSVSRSAELGPLLGGANLALSTLTGADMFRAGRSTIDPRSVALPKDPLRSDAGNIREGGQQFGQQMYDLFPAARTVVGAGVMASGATGVATKNYGYQRDMEKRAFFEGLGSLAPNDPAVQWLIQQWAEQSGASGKDMY